MAKMTEMATAKVPGIFESLVDAGRIATVTPCAWGSRCLDKDGDPQFIPAASSGKLYLLIDCIVKQDGDATSLQRQWYLYKDGIEKVHVDILRQLGFDHLDVDDDELRRLAGVDCNQEITEAVHAAAFVNSLRMPEDDFLVKYVFNKQIRMGKPPKSYDVVNGWKYYSVTANPELLKKTKESVLAEQEARYKKAAEMPEDPDEIGGDD